MFHWPTHRDLIVMPFVAMATKKLVGFYQVLKTPHLCLPDFTEEYHQLNVTQTKKVWLDIFTFSFSYTHRSSTVVNLVLKGVSTGFVLGLLLFVLLQIQDGFQVFTRHLLPHLQINLDEEGEIVSFNKTLEII